jgi:hypothetical protein
MEMNMNSYNSLLPEINSAIEISLDSVQYKIKPKDYEIAIISKRIASNKQALRNPNDVKDFAEQVGQQGYTFCPATFNNGVRNLDNFEQLQLLALDFDGGISWREVKERTDEYDLPILFAYETLSSVDKNKFRVVFLNDLALKDKLLVKIAINALLTIYPEADRACDDVSRMFFGGKNLLYFDNSLPTINTEKLFRVMTYFLFQKHKPNHYKEHVKRFADKNGIQLNNKGLLDITAIASLTELTGNRNIYPQGGKNPPPFIIFSTLGDYFPPPPLLATAYYRINLSGTLPKSFVVKKRLRNHGEYRSCAINEMPCKCGLFYDFVTGSRKLNHKELFGLVTNIIHVETGREYFRVIMNKYPNYYKSSKLPKWDYYLKYVKEQNYSPQGCSSFCVYNSICNHATNILTTVKPKRGIMEKIPGYMEEYHSIEIVQEDFKQKLEMAIKSKEIKWHIIKAQTAIGKTETFLKLMQASGKVFLIAVPTNILKHDVYNRAVNKGINVRMSPSIDELKGHIPDENWKYIQILRKKGQHKKVHIYISKMAKERQIEAFVEYLEQKKDFELFGGHAIITHRKLMNMSEKEINKYDVVIIDEDIILSSIVSDQCKISISDLRMILDKSSVNPAYIKLCNKISQALEKIKTEVLFSLPGFKHDEKSVKKSKKEDNCGIEDIPGIADIASFCLAERFMYKEGSNKIDDLEESIVFLRPYSFKNVKYIMLSATADKDVCGYCFGKENVIFSECKYAPYEGILNQYYGKSMSRSSIDGNQGILDKIMEKSGFKLMITFKKYNEGPFHFGNAIGCDELSGLNINVVGTPYKVDFIYKLAAYTFGCNVDANAKMELCRLQHNGYQFNFTAYNEDFKELRKILIWMVESDLEQAVGRARLLRKKCTVNLYSNFPLRQAIMNEAS